MTTPTSSASTKPYVTKTGRVLSDADIDALADEVAGGIDVETLKPRRGGRPPLDGGPADVVPVRLDANLRLRNARDRTSERAAVLAGRTGPDRTNSSYGPRDSDARISS